MGRPLIPGSGPPQNSSDVSTPHFHASFEGTILAFDRFRQAGSVIGNATQSSGALLINPTSVTGVGRYKVETFRTFGLYSMFGMAAEFVIKVANETATNSFIEFGFGIAPDSVAVTSDGAFFRFDASGVLNAVLSYGGVETISAIRLPGSTINGLPAQGVYHRYRIEVSQAAVSFGVDEYIPTTIGVPSTVPLAASSYQQPMFARVVNTGAASAARQVSIGYLAAFTRGINDPISRAHAACMAGAGSYQVQPGTASGQTANYANSTAPVSATLSNTAAGYTTLGGQYQFAAVVGAATDYALFGYQNPLGSATLPGRNLVVTGIRIGEIAVTGAVTGASSTQFFWSAGVGSTAVSLATVDSITTVGPRRIPLGCQSVIAVAPIGTTAPGFAVDFTQSPLVVHPGLFLHIVFNQLNGAATVSLVWRGTVTVIGYNE